MILSVFDVEGVVVLELEEPEEEELDELEGVGVGAELPASL